jgi:hypothetical protein
VSAISKYPSSCSVLPCVVAFGSASLGSSSASLSVRVRVDRAQLRPGCLFVRVQEQCFHFFVCPF